MTTATLSRVPVGNWTQLKKAYISQGFRRGKVSTDMLTFSFSQVHINQYPPAVGAILVNSVGLVFRAGRAILVDDFHTRYSNWNNKSTSENEAKFNRLSVEILGTADPSLEFDLNPSIELSTLEINQLTGVSFKSYDNNGYTRDITSLKQLEIMMGLTELMGFHRGMIKVIGSNTKIPTYRPEKVESGIPHKTTYVTPQLSLF